jgi:hypothetical protein
MSMTNAQRQERFRRRHLGRDLVRVSVNVRGAVRDRLDRLAWHYDCSLVALVEKLAEAAERHVEARLTGEALAMYRAAGYEDTA